MTSQQYRGSIIDKMGTMDTLQTKWYPTYQQAHDAAEALCKRTMGSRGEVDVKAEGGSQDD